jgi:cell division protein FtsB
MNISPRTKKYIFFACLMLAGYYACTGQHGLFAFIKLKRLCLQQQERIIAMQKEITWLQAENKAWQENPFKKEEFARLELGMGYTNELMYQLK